MTDRVADTVGDVLAALEDLDYETDEQLAELAVARESLKNIAAIDRERNGQTPSDELAAAVERTDVCLVCGDPVDEGAFCSMACLTEAGGG